MSKITLIENEYASLVYLSDVKIVHHTFHKPIGGLDFREVLNTGTKTLEKHYWALVVPQDMLARMNMKEFVDSYFEQGLRIGVFIEPEEAMRWLKICDLPPHKWIGRLSDTATKGK